MKILITGGAGYIGSHLIIGCLKNGHEVIVVDDFSNSKQEPLLKIRKNLKKFDYFRCDICNFQNILNILKDTNPEVIIHLAGYKSVQDSELNPLLYYDNNLKCTINLLKAMDVIGCKKILFSSSATIYEEIGLKYLKEESSIKPKSVYGFTKFFNEKIIEDWQRASKENSAITLRYFNPAGSSQTGLVGEEINDEASNLFPSLVKACLENKVFTIFGNDYDTKDGTCLRDFIHIEDLVDGHILALVYLKNKCIYEVFNLGTGKSYSVLEIYKTFKSVNNLKIPLEFKKRRAGDISVSFASIEKAKRILNWRPKKNLNDICKDTWHWIKLIKNDQFKK